MMNGISLFLVALPLLLLTYFAHKLVSSKDPRAPPVVPSRIPIVGHAISLLREGTLYYAKLSKQHPDLPVYGINIIVTTIYVINSPAMVKAMQHERTLTLLPFMGSATVRMFGFTGSAAALLAADPDDEKSFIKKITEAMSPPLLGPGLDRMNEKMAKQLKRFVDGLSVRAANQEPIELFSWCRHAITLASTSAVYGPQNPFQHKEVEDAFWMFESEIVFLYFNLVPWLSARRAIRARETQVRAFERYFENGGYEDSSDMTRARWNLQHHELGLPLREIARLEAGTPLGLLVNTVPATFWMLFDLYSRPQLLHEIREELRQSALCVEPDGTCVIDLGHLRDRCSLLVSTFQEMLRLRTMAALIRTGKRDVVLGDRYLIKAGSAVQIPGPAFSRSEDAWGVRPDEFDPWRFVRGSHNDSGSGTEQKDSARKVSSFLAFGTMPDMCPGRHFASGEILAATAMMVLRFDLVPEEGEWKEPPTASMALALSVNGPAGDLNVKLKLREDWKDAKWDFRVTPGKGRFGLITG